ncbi:tRNA (adenosine(37)-N6)-threonylcarbamoyltransferase complex ATPase subunit type 1 TsaE [Flavobacteriales bacterium]|jgi:tRNA threonylcarbamoyladenosine biosynthesis protein TsaE|nr:tRNA (adenosine(37)-N6)-threonylcarbamoyltransferase complex ATPase subunit type 1 TsaE [Flavobacteriales bacterium]
MSSYSFVVNNISDLDQVAHKIQKMSKINKIFLFEGEMGSGKTTLIKKIVALLGVYESNSPTFSIINTYLGSNNQTIYHVDCYRIENESEVENIGLLEILNEKNLCFIEWPKKIHNFLPDNCVRIIINLKEDIRKILIQS